MAKNPRNRTVSSATVPLPRRYRRTALSLAVAAALPLAVAVPSNVLAQDASEDDGDVMEEIVTYGTYRRSIVDSIAAKRESSSIVETISAEDIGKLPDSSIAESLARLPGLAGQRLDGRSSVIAIRGLGENFSNATLNGREQVSIGNNRGIEFDLYPSEIMSGVTVYKTPDASLMSQGIAGTIDLQTVRPLHHESVLQINANFEQNGHDKLNPDGDDQGWRGTFSYIDNFADETVGIALAVATMDSPNQEERWNSWGFPSSDSADATCGGCLVLGGAKPFVRSSTLSRDTIMGVLEFEPNDQLRVTADALYIDFEDEKILRGIEMPGAWAQTTDVVAGSDGLVTQGVWQDVKGQIRNDFELRQAELTSFGLNVEFALNDRWTLTGDASHGEVDGQTWSLESYSGSGRSSDATAINDDIGFVMGSGNLGATFSPTLDYSDDSLFQLGGAQGWGNGSTVPNDGQDGFINNPSIEDELNTFRLSAEAAMDNGFISSVEFGVYYADREKSRLDQGTFLTLPQYPGTASIPGQYRLPNTSLAFIGMGEMISYRSFAFWKDGNYTETSENLTVSNRAISSWTVNEEVTIAYAMANFDTEMGSVGFSGNLGVQVVDTDQSSDGFAVAVVDGLVQAQPTSGGASFTEVLPSFNASFDVADDQKVRVGIARTMTRSRMERMNASFGFSFNTANNTMNADINNSPWGGSGANPQLRPQMADQFDLSYEYYFADDGYVAVAYFFKDLKDWQIRVDEVVDFSGITPPGGQVAEFNLGIVSHWQNSDGGDVSGFEIQGAIPGGVISDALEGFGIQASATFLDSSLKVGGTEIKVPGLSEEIYNLTLYYENNGFEARISGNKRDDFLGEVNAISFTRDLVSVQGTELLDAQISYDFAESGIEMLRGLKLTFQAQNLTNEPFITFNNGDPRQIRDFQNYDRNYLFGFSYRF